MWKFKDKTHKTVFRIKTDGNIESALADRHQPYLDWLAEGNSTEPEDVIPLAELKRIKITEINAESQSIILAKYPADDQIKAAIGVYTTAYTTQMRTDMALVMEIREAAIIEVQAAVEETGVNTVNPVWPVI